MSSGNWMGTRMMFHLNADARTSRDPRVQSPAATVLGAAALPVRKGRSGIWRSEHPLLSEPHESIATTEQTADAQPSIERGDTADRCPTR